MAASSDGVVNTAERPDEEVFEEGFRRLTEARLALAADQAESFGDFKLRIRGGGWLIATEGRGLDATEGYAVNKAAKAFCVRRGMKQSIKLDRDLHGVAGASIVCRAWNSRMQFLYNLEVDGLVSEAENFRADDLLDYLEPSEFTRLLESAEGDLLVRARQVRALPNRAA